MKTFISQEQIDMIKNTRNRSVDKFKLPKTQDIDVIKNDVQILVKEDVEVYEIHPANPPQIPVHVIREKKINFSIKHNIFRLNEIKII